MNGQTLADVWKQFYTSKRFWLLVVAFIGWVITYFVGKYAAPAVYVDIQALWDQLQDLILWAIGAFTVSDVAFYIAAGKNGQLIQPNTSLVNEPPPTQVAE